MSTLQIRDLPAKSPLDGSELVELQEAAGGAGSSKQAPSGSFLSPDYISGLKMVWGSANSLSVTSGAAYVSSLGRVVRLGATANLSALVLTASTWYHLYLYLNAGAPAVECVATAPSAAYYGTARTKTGDTSRRYIGSVLTDASSNIFNFFHNLAGNLVRYRVINDATPFKIVSGGTASVPTSVSCAGVVPITSSLVISTSKNNDAASSVLITTSDSGFTLNISNFSENIPANSGISGFLSLDSSQAFLYMYGATPSGSWVSRVSGYTYER